jgi:hypothetical protein
MKVLHTRGGAAAVLVLLAGLLVSPAISPPSTAAATTPCVDGNPTLRDLELAAGDDYEGPVAREFGTDPALVSEIALDCYGGRTLRFVAFVRDPGAVGWTHPFGLKPAWFRAGSFFVAARDDLEPGTGPISALAVPPDLGDLQAKHVGHWVRVTGHFDDLAARTCVATGEPAVAPTTTEAVVICRSTFVVESVTRTSPPATTTVAVDQASAESPGPPIEPGYVAGWLGLSAVLGALLLAWLRERRVV